MKSKFLPESHLARGYLEMDDVIKTIERWLQSQAPSACGYSSKAIKKRLAQRALEIMLRAFLRERVRRYDAGTQALASQDRLLRCAGVVVNTVTGNTRPSIVLFGRSVTEFLLLWAYALCEHLYSLIRATGRSKGPAVLLFGVGIADLKAGGGDARFIEYCRNGPITPLAEARRLIVQAAGQLTSSLPEFVSYSRSPLYALVRENPIGVRQFLGFLLQHCCALVAYFAAVVHCPLVSILGRDFACHAMVSSLNHRGLLESVVITNSNISSQPLWMSDILDRCFASHMAWYSINNAFALHKADPVVADDPYFRHIRVDEVWTWTDEHVRELRKIGAQGVMHVVGPILWYLLQPAQTNRSGKEICLAVFDVTPVKPDVAESLGLLRNYFYTRSENMTRFIEDIVYACAAIEQATGRRVRILLKHKRSYYSTHDPDYISMIEKISGPGQPVELLPPDTNMYSLISGCDLTLVIPYSSPAYVATSLGCQAIYYDPTMEVQPVYNKQPFLTFVAGRANLVNAMMAMLDGGSTKTIETGAAQ